MEENENALNFY